VSSASYFVSVVSLSHTEALPLTGAAPRELGRPPLEARWLRFSLSASGLCHVAAIGLLMSLAFSVTTTDVNLSGRPSVLTVVIMDAPSVADPEFTRLAVEIPSAVMPPHPSRVEPCPTPVTRTQTPPPAPQLTMILHEPIASLDTISPPNHSPPRARSRQSHPQPRMTIEPISPAPRRTPARLPASVAVAVPAIPASVTTTAARPLDNPLPEYPIEAVPRAIRGRVTLRVTVSPEGTALGLEVAETSGYRWFDDSAVKTVKDWEFEPARRQGQPVRSTVLIRIRFLPR
jgi:protein TonB